MQAYGIIGQPLEHSWSPRYFKELFEREGIDATYSMFPLKGITEVRDVMARLKGFSVTIPYKEAILPYLDEVDEVAKAIGAVNVVHGKKGYNTDWLGFTQSVLPYLRTDVRRALVLGTGGVSKAVQYALGQRGIACTLVSHSGQANSIPYAQVSTDMVAQHLLIVNCTPLGMWPVTDACPDIPYESIGNRHVLFDCIYNPEQTLFLRKGQARGAQIVNGLQMLHNQAQEAWAIWKESIHL